MVTLVEFTISTQLPLVVLIRSPEEVTLLWPLITRVVVNGVGVALGVGLGVGVDVALGVNVGAGVGVGAEVGVDFGVGVGEGFAVGVGEGRGVGVDLAFGLYLARERMKSVEDVVYATSMPEA